MTPEEQILLLTSFYSLSSDQVQVLGDLMNKGPDWNQIIAASRFHSLTPLLARHISEGNLQDKLPPSAWEKIIGFVRLQTARRLKLISVFQELSAIFNEKQIDFILLKGLHLADTCYSNPALRPMQDIDLLVKEKDLDRVIQIMNQSGATRMVELQSDFINSFLQHIPPFIYKDVMIEIHTNLVAANEPYSFTSDTLWNNTVILEIQKVNARVFCLELNLIYLCVHLFRHIRTAKFKLIWFTDLLQLLSVSNSFDSSEINLLAKETRSEETLNEVSFFLRDIWNSRILEKLSIPSQEPDIRVLQNFRKGILRKYKPDAYYSVEDWRHIPGIINKLRFALGFAFPSVAFMKKKYKLRHPLPLIPLYPYNAMKVLFRGITILFNRLFDF